MADELVELTRSTALKAIESVLSLEEDWDGWEFVSDTNDVISSRKPAPSGYYYIRGQGEISASVERILAVLKDSSQKPNYDKMTLHEFSESLKINHHQYKAPWPVSNRDFVFAVDERRLDDGGFVIVGKSVELPTFPPQSGVVRGEMDFGGFILRPIEGGKTRVTYIVHVDPKGSVPTMVVNYTQTEQSQVVHYLRVLLAAN
mmetsp:Transcript_2588/g.5868  ORF Transcript_2588/g.5868 Transcript_2588/m.5868 type:complete len:202 (-) Transcript_2588:21-626(-)